METNTPKKKGAYSTNTPKKKGAYSTNTPKKKGAYSTLTDPQKVAIIDDHLRTLQSSLKRCPIPKSPEGLHSCLNHEELLLLIWLSWREKEHPSGGILVDEEDFGTIFKTIIALVMQEKYARGTIDEAEDFVKSNTTLIVCPASDLDQEEEEVILPEKVLNLFQTNKPRIKIHYKNKRLVKIGDLNEIDLLVTTYGTLSSDLEELLKNETPKLTDLEFSPDLPVLAKVDWKRIISFKAISIKSEDSKKAKVICKLKARARWAMTLTKDQTEEMFPLARFLRCPLFDDKDMWEVLNKKTAESQRLLATLKEALFYSV